ncbi:MAG: hypothetical protein IID36_10695 [Planctomycetes bacterium]|nr:hypothetical protein [Planctomycetota bacterium]
MRKSCIVGTTLAFALATAAVAANPEKGNTSSPRRAVSVATAEGVVPKSLVPQGSSGGGFAGNPVLGHSNSDEIEAFNSVACSSDQGVTTEENHFYRSFDLAFFGVVGEYVTAFIELGIETNASSVPFPAFVVVYNDVNGGAPLLNDLDELASLDFPIPAGFTGIIALPMTATVPANGTAVVELGYLSVEDVGINGGLWPGSSVAGQTPASSATRPTCSP